MLVLYVPACTLSGNAHEYSLLATSRCTLTEALASKIPRSDANSSATAMPFAHLLVSQQAEKAA